MQSLRSTNPALTAVFAQPQTWDAALGSERRPGAMTLQGSVTATMILLGLCSATAVAVWWWMGQQAELSRAALPAALGSAVVALILGLVITFKPRTAPVLAPVYAVLEGAFVGAISWVYAASFGDQIVFQAGLLTFGILAALLVAYKSRLIRPTENFKLGVAAATMGVMFLFLATFLLQLFGVTVPYLWDSSPIGIGIAGVIVVIAALNLVLDFDFIERASEAGQPKHMEWYAGFGMLVTLVWLYLSLLRLLALLGDRD
ncbi:MAG TPA: Bax inhibitor-1/YccA family protein [Phycisphaerales bacterium]|nr:Bax inhibitor-1/YccA family protein [Phycisphaerales bacterium]